MNPPREPNQIMSRPGPILRSFSSASPDQWRQAAEKTLKGAPFEKKLVTRTHEGIDLQPIYFEENAPGRDGAESWPGFTPYLRGAHPLGNAPAGWGIAQEVAARTASEFNNRLLSDLEHGQNSVHLRPDISARAGRDPDAAPASDVGRDGISIATTRDFADALRGVDLQRFPICVDAESAAIPMTALFVAWARMNGRDLRALRGGIEMDPLGAMAASGTLPRSVGGALDRMAQLVEWGKRHAPGFRFVTVHGHPYHESGAHAAQELGFAMATGLEYLRELTARGVPVDDTAPRMRFAFSIGGNLFMEIAKLRAARVLWCRIVEACGGREESRRMTMHVRTGKWSATLLDPHVNLLRGTVAAFAGAIGGCDSMHVAPFDEAAREPDEFSRRIARNVQVILQHECHLHRVVDPAGGSWYVESLTDSIADAAWKHFQDVERAGGMTRALVQGGPQEEVHAAADRKLAGLASRRELLVGANIHPDLRETPLPPAPTDGNGLAEARADFIREYRTSSDARTSTEVMDALGILMNAAPDEAVEAAIAAATAGATIGELARALRSGDETPTVVQPLRRRRWSEEFETLRSSVSRYRERTGATPKVFLAKMGPPAQHQARADFSAGFLEVGGFEVLGGPASASPEAAADSAAASGSGAVVICSTDDTYSEIAPPLIRRLRAAGSEAPVLIAGNPEGQVDFLRKNGVHGFIHLRSNLLETLTELQKALGV